jgi:preprotein translocase subunit SecG
MDFMLLGAVKWWAQSLAVIFFVVCVVLVILVLLQKGRGGGLAGAFGGIGGQSAFGSKTGDVFTWVTIVVVVAFLALAMFLTVNYKPSIQSEKDALDITNPNPATPQPQEVPATEGVPAEKGAVDAGASAPAPVPAPVETAAQPEKAPAGGAAANTDGGGGTK